MQDLSLSMQSIIVLLAVPFLIVSFVWNVLIKKS